MYIHLRADTSEVFYVGKGVGKRAKVDSDRSQKWHTIVKEAGGFIVEILHSNLSNDEAVSIENSLITNPKPDWVLVNVAKASTINVLDKNELEKMFRYDVTSPSGIRWIKSDTTSAMHLKPAGTLTKQNRWQVCVNKKIVFVHRIIATMHDMYLVGNVVDHIDGNGSNNIISNLRCVPQAENTRNNKLRSNNKSGVIGVRYVPSTESWRAEWCNLEGKCLSKTFFCSKYGKEEAFRLACEWRKQKIEELNAAGAGYTDRHGT